MPLLWFLWRACRAAGFLPGAFRKRVFAAGKCTFNRAQLLAGSGVKHVCAALRGGCVESGSHISRRRFSLSPILPPQDGRYGFGMWAASAGNFAHVSKQSRGAWEKELRMMWENAQEADT